MTKAVIGFPRWTSLASFSTTGSAASGYGVSNLGTLPLAQVWRSASAATANTTFTATLDKPRGVQTVALVGHNLSQDATIRIRLYEDAAKTVLTHDTGAVAVWASVYPSDLLLWSDERWWDGKYLADEIKGGRWTRPFFFPLPFRTQAIQVDIVDTANPDGFVQCGLFEVAQGWQVSVNFGYGAEVGFRHRTQSVEAIGGAQYFERRPSPRVFRGSIDYLPEDEAIALGWEHQRQMGLDVPFLWLPNPAATLHLPRLSFLARNVDPGLIGLASHGRCRLPLAFEEVL